MKSLTIWADRGTFTASINNQTIAQTASLSASLAAAALFGVPRQAIGGWRANGSPWRMFPSGAVVMEVLWQES